MTSGAKIDLNQHHLERLIFFSDAVFAIAMTLLVVDIHLPELPVESEAALGQALGDLIPGFISFVISFLVIGQFWVSHHRLFGLLKGGRARIIWINLFFLMAVAFMPFPTALYSHHIGLRVGVGVYAGWLIVIGLLNRRLTNVVLGDPRLLEDDVDPEELADRRRRTWIPIWIGVVALALGMIHPLLAQPALIVGSPLIAWLFRRYAAKRVKAPRG